LNPQQNTLEARIAELERDVARYRAAWRRAEDANAKLQQTHEADRAYFDRLPYPSDYHIAEREIRDLNYALKVIDQNNDAQLAKRALDGDFNYIREYGRSIGIEESS
jgi:hypothetical protein